MMKKPTVMIARNVIIWRQREPFSSRVPKTSAPMHEPTANIASCTPSRESRCNAFITAVIDVSNAVKLMLNTMNTIKSGITPA